MTRRAWTALLAGGLVLSLGTYRVTLPANLPGEAGPQATAQLPAQPEPGTREQREARAESAFAALEKAELAADLLSLVERADRFLTEFGDTARASEVRRRHAAYLQRIDARDIESARAYSASHADEFAGRLVRFQSYLDRHPAGAFAEEAMNSITAVAAEWDRDDYRRARERFYARPFDPVATATLCRRYAAAHSSGRYRTAIAELQRWCERAGVAGEYRVVLKSGIFGRSVSAWLSRGPRISIELEVGGIRHGPSPIAARGLEATWNYEFPRRIRWRPGDPVAFRVSDHWYWQRVVLATTSEDDDPFAMRLLSGPITLGEHSLVFESDFRMPELPEPE